VTLNFFLMLETLSFPNNHLSSSSVLLLLPYDPDAPMSSITPIFPSLKNDSPFDPSLHFIYLSPRKLRSLQSRSSCSKVSRPFQEEGLSSPSMGLSYHVFVPKRSVPPTLSSPPALISAFLAFPDAGYPWSRPFPLIDLTTAVFGLVQGSAPLPPCCFSPPLRVLLPMKKILLAFFFFPPHPFPNFPGQILSGYLTRVRVYATI